MTATMGQRVLLIDDDKSVAEATKIVLESEGFDVVVAQDGRAGLTVLEAGRFDLAIVDLFMPGMDGFATAKGLHEIDPSLPTVAMSGFMFRGACPPMPDFCRWPRKPGHMRRSISRFVRMSFFGLSSWQPPQAATPT
jgi:two-component SAPR family response regulator